MARATDPRALPVARAFARRAGAARLLFACLCAVAPLPPCAAELSAVQIPARDDAIVEQLPTHVGDPAQRRAARAGERAQRRALEQHPDELGLALQAADDALARGRLRGDPRELGVAQAALAPWWRLADAPPEVRLVRAIVLQSRHEFEAAIAELDAVLALPAGVTLPVRAQAELTRSGIQQVLGHFAQAEAGCRRLAGADFRPLGASVRLNAQACLAELGRPARPGRRRGGHARAPRGRPRREQRRDRRWRGRAGLADLDARRARATARRPGRRRAVRRGVAGRCRRSITGVRTPTGCSIQHRPADVVALLEGHEAADPVLLRVALAYKQLHGSKSRLTVAATTMLGERYDAALLHGDRSHGREQSRYELELRGDARAALALARSNWQVQHEPADAVVLARAAHAAHRDEAAEPLWQFLRDTGGRDARLAVGGPLARPFLPVAFAPISSPRSDS